MRDLLAILCLLSVAGCSATSEPTTPVQTPYKVVRTLASGKALPSEELLLGVTQAKLSDTNYLIAVKLGAYSTMRRAHSMALFHAAKIAQESGYQGFTVDQTQKNGWCQTLRTRNTEFIQGSHGGVTTRLVVSLTNDSAVPNFKSADTVLAFHQPIIADVPTADELEQIAADRTERCLAQSQQRTGRRLLNNQ